MSRKFGSWLLGLFLVIFLAGTYTPPANAQVVVRIGHRHHHHRYYHHHHGYYR